MTELDSLTEYFKRFPGIGPRQARRFVYYLLRQNKSDVENFTKSVLDLRDHIQVCEMSFCHFYRTGDEKLSPIERSIVRDNSILMIVSGDTDMENVEKQKVYSGKYFVLGGLITPTDTTPEDKIRSRELISSLSVRLKNGLKEIIIAMPIHRDGEHTTDYLLRLLEPLSRKHNIKISTLGRGMSTGTELEYIDEHTMKSALENRK